MNDNQNALVTRSTSRVLVEPGGKSSMGFLLSRGSSAPKPTPTAKVTLSAATNNTNTAKGMTSTPPKVSVNEKEEESAILAAVRIKAKNEAQHFSLFSPGPSNAANGNTNNKVSSNAFASSSSANSYNIIADRSTTRVLRPPGGHSSIKLG